MPKFGSLIKSLAEKAKINAEDESLKKLLATQEISMLEVPDDFANALERNLLTEESAKANPAVRSALMAEALNGVDAKIETILTDFEFDDTVKGEVKGIKNTYEKLSKVTGNLKDQLKAAKEKASQTKNPQDKAEVEALKREIENANTQMENLKRMQQAEIENLKAANLNDKKEFTLKSVLAGRPLPKNGLPQEINILTAKTLIQQEMAKHGLNVSFDEAGNPILKQRKDGADLDYYVDNKKVDFSGFIDGVLAQNKFVQINDQQQQQSSNGGATGNNGSQPATGVPTNTSIAAESRSKLAQLGIGAAV
jgi:hypothetical protein